MYNCGTLKTPGCDISPNLLRSIRDFKRLIVIGLRIRVVAWWPTQEQVNKDPSAVKGLKRAIFDFRSGSRIPLKSITSTSLLPRARVNSKFHYGTLKKTRHRRKVRIRRSGGVRRDHF